MARPPGSDLRPACSSPPAASGREVTVRAGPSPPPLCPAARTACRGPLQGSPRPRVPPPSVPAATLRSHLCAQTFPPLARATAPPDEPRLPAPACRGAPTRRWGRAASRGDSCGGGPDLPADRWGAARAARSRGGADAPGQPPARHPPPGASIKGGAGLRLRSQRSATRSAHHGPPGPAAAAAAVSAAPRLRRAPRAPQVSPRSRSPHRSTGPPSRPCVCPPPPPAWP